MAFARPQLFLSLTVLAASCSTMERDDARRFAGEREAMSPRIAELVQSGRFGGELWRMSLSETTAKRAGAARAEVVDDLLIVQDDRHQVHAIETKNGVHRFVLDLPGTITQDVGSTKQTLTFVCTDDLVAVDRRNGARTSARTTMHLDFFPSGRAVANDRSVFVGRLAPFSVQAISMGTGMSGWAYSTSSPVVDLANYGDGPLAQIVGITEDGLVFSLPPFDAMRGRWAPKENWFHHLPTTRIETPLTLTGSDIFFGSDTGFLYRMDLRSGSVAWKYPAAGSMRGQAAVVAGGVVFQRAGDQLAAINLDKGTQLWTVDHGMRLITRISDRCYVALPGDRVTVRKADTGVELASFSTAGLAHVPTIQGGGMFIAGDRYGNLFALK